MNRLWNCALKICRLMVAISVILIFFSSLQLFALAKADISYTQLFLIPGNAETNDDCGQFYSYFVYKPTSNVWFEVTGGNSSGIFNLDQNTGKISIKNKTSLAAGVYKLQITCHDGGLTDIDTAIITVKDAKYCVFIDPSGSTSGTGTRTSPFNSWDKISTFKAGYAYLQKRNTTNKTTEIIVSAPGGYANNRLAFGTYGKGERPVLDGTLLDQGCAGFWFGSPSNPVAYVDIYSYVIHSSKGIKSEKGGNHLRIFDCDIYNCRDNGGIFLKDIEDNSLVSLYNEIYNTVSHHNNTGEYHGIKASAGTFMKNCAVHHNLANGITAVNNNVVDHCYAYSNQCLGIEAQGAHIVFTNNRAEGNYNGLSTDSGSDIKFINNISEGNYHGISIDYSTDNILIEKNILAKNTVGIEITGGSSELVIRRNSISDCSSYGIVMYGYADYPGLEEEVDIHYNLIYRTTKAGISVSDASSIKIYNNTILGDIVSGSSTSQVVAKNNIAANVSGNLTQGNNVKISDVSVFLDYAKDNFRLKSSALNLIDKGVAVGLSVDYDGNKLVNAPDLGAFEYVSSSSQTNNDAEEEFDDPNTVYIDPENANDMLKNGSKAHPFSSWKEVQWTPGFTYRQKRGTTSNDDRITIAANNITIGSYGSGELPGIVSNSSDYVFKFFEKSNITIQNIKINADEAIACIYSIGETSSNNIIENCIFEGAENGIRIISGNLFTIRYNTFIKLNEAIYSFARNNKIYYNIFRDNAIGISAYSASSEMSIYNNVFFSNHSGILNSLAQMILYNNIFYLSEDDDIALQSDLNLITSDNNLFYPEQDGFVIIDDQRFSNMNSYSETTNLDMNSFSSDPLFVNPYENDFNIGNLSPAIDAGRNLNIAKDYSGTSVPSGEGTDIGIIEKEGIKGLQNMTIEDDNEMVLYPNPSNGIVNVYTNTDLPDEGSIKILSLNGQVIYSESLASKSSPNSFIIDTSDMQSGIYILSIQTAGKNMNKKLIRQ